MIIEVGFEFDCDLTMAEVRVVASRNCIERCMVEEEITSERMFIL